MKALVKFGLLVALALGSVAARASDVAQLQNGFTIRHERREIIGNTTRLYLDAASSPSYVDVPTADIVSIDHEAEAVSPAALPAPAPSTDVQAAVTAASGASGLDPDLIDSVIKAESNFNPHAVSRKGARGLMQLMPSTAQQLGVKDSFDPGANVDAGSRYLRDLLLQYNRDLAKALAAYNAGAQRVDRYHGVPPYHETYSYVSRIIADFNRKKLAERAALHHQNSVTEKNGARRRETRPQLSLTTGAGTSSTE